MNGLNNFDETDREYTLSHTDDLEVEGQEHSRLLRSKLVNTISHEPLEQSQ